MYQGLSYYIKEENTPVCDISKNVTDISIFTMMRTYSRNILNESGDIIGLESFKQIVERVVNGLISILKDRLTELGTIDNYNLDEMANKFYRLIYSFKVTPPGRGFWAMGTKLVHKDKMSLSLVNCAFITSENIEMVKAEFFAFVMDALMLGVGVGFDDRGADKLKINHPVTATEQVDITNIIELIDNEFQLVEKDEYTRSMLLEEINYIRSTNGHASIHVIEDSRTGWVYALRALLDSYFYPGKNQVIFDTTKIRKKGTLLKTFGGTSGGPTPLIKGLSQIRLLLIKKINNYLDTELICDICNIIATIVIAGNVRRSSEIFLSKSDKMIKMKDYGNPKYSHRMYWGWSSNNSMIVDAEDNFDSLLEKMSDTIKLQGEPGIFNEYLSRHYGRIIDGDTSCDLKVNGTNPCGEISLEGTDVCATNEPYSAGGETCNLSEVHISNYVGKDLEATIEEIGNDMYYAVLYCKIVTLIEPNWQATKEIQNRNRRIGVSQTGISTFLGNYNISLDKYKDIVDGWYNKIKQYDIEISEMLNINKSIKLTTVKPSGTVTLCGGGFSCGMHATPSKYFMRTIRISKKKKGFINALKNKGFYMEDCVNQPDETKVIYFPCRSKPNELTKPDISIEYQFELLSILQTYWSDNQVSCTITFTDEESDKIIPLIIKYKNSLKSVSLLKLDTTFYKQSPEIKIDELQYNEMVSKITPLIYEDFINNTYKEEETDMYCSGGKCIKEQK